MNTLNLTLGIFTAIGIIGIVGMIYMVVICWTDDAKWS